MKKINISFILFIFIISFHKIEARIGWVSTFDGADGGWTSVTSGNSYVYNVDDDTWNGNLDGHGSILNDWSVLPSTSPIVPGQLTGTATFTLNNLDATPISLELWDSPDEISDLATPVQPDFIGNESNTNGSVIYRLGSGGMAEGESITMKFKTNFPLHRPRLKFHTPRDWTGANDHDGNPATPGQHRDPSGEYGGAEANGQPFKTMPYIPEDTKLDFQAYQWSTSTGDANIDGEFVNLVEANMYANSYFDEDIDGGFKGADKTYSADGRQVTVYKWQNGSNTAGYNFTYLYFDDAGNPDISYTNPPDNSNEPYSFTRNPVNWAIDGILVTITAPVGGLPEGSIFGWTIDGIIPEPSSALYLFFALFSYLIRRKR